MIGARAAHPAARAPRACGPGACPWKQHILAPHGRHAWAIPTRSVPHSPGDSRNRGQNHDSPVADRSIPASAITSMTAGFTVSAGADPAELTSIRLADRCVRKAAAIWGRPALCTHTNSTDGLPETVSHTSGFFFEGSRLAGHRGGLRTSLQTGERSDRDTGQSGNGMDSCRGDKVGDGSCEPSSYFRGIPVLLCQWQNSGRTGLGDYYSPVS